MTGPIVCFGELLLRLAAPRGEFLLQSDALNVQFGGAEANVAIGLARLGHATRVVSAVPTNALGDAVIANLRRWGVDVSGVVRADGRLGLYFVSPGASVRPGEILYDRAGSAFARGGHRFPWATILQGASRLHLSGITPALGPDAFASALAAVEAAASASASVPVSFDGNYRPSLWAGRGADAPAMLRRLVAHADLLFGDVRDLRLLLGSDVAQAEAHAAAFQAFPKLRLIAGVTREAITADRHRLSARLQAPDRHAVSPVVEVEIVDRIGAGDAFAAGVLHALADRPGDLDHAAQTGLALSALKHCQIGDASLATRDQLEAFWDGRQDVRR